jgi:DNA-binding transcriptional regulator YiaG
MKCEMIESEELSFFHRLERGLKDSVAHSRGELNLRSTELPAPPPPASPARVVRLRRRFNMSQSVFAAALNVSVKLVQSWEQGVRRPDRGELRLIQIFDSDPQILAKLFASRGQSKTSKVRRATRRETYKTQVGTGED